jgi:trimeric autotransporter adhesin
MKQTSRFTITILSFFWLLTVQPTAQAVVPPPDGGYPNFTTAEGQKALFSLTSGAANTAIGWSALSTNTAGNFNTATGAGALVFNIADDNTALGAAALLFNITGMDNTAVGAAALSNNTMGMDNTATGAFALLLNTTGNSNTATGFDALFSNTTGQFNIAIGFGSLDHSTTGDDNTAVGASALQGNIDGDNNTAIGLLALGANTAGSSNTAVGWNALAGNTTGLNNIAIGAATGGSITTANNVICIGTNVSGEDVSNSCYIGNIFGQTASGGSAVFVASNGRLGTSTSSRRFKESIEPMGQASEAVLALEPVSFRYKKQVDPAQIPQFGLVAEDVEKVNPDLVVRDKEGKAYSVRYDQVNAMLLNEFLKEHRKVEKLEETVADLAAQLQKVTSRVETIQATAQVALSTQ